MATICIEEIHVHVLTVYSCTCTIIYYIHGNYRGDTCTCTNSVLQYIAVHVLLSTIYMATIEEIHVHVLTVYYNIQLYM